MKCRAYSLFIDSKSAGSPNNTVTLHHERMSGPAGLERGLAFPNHLIPGKLSRSWVYAHESRQKLKAPPLIPGLRRGEAGASDERILPSTPRSHHLPFDNSWPPRAQRSRRFKNLTCARLAPSKTSPG